MSDDMVTNEIENEEIIQNGLITQDQYNELVGIIHNATLVMDRELTASSRYGKMYGGDRDIPKAAGYKAVKTFSDYNGKYLFQGVATRIIEAAPDSTWQEAPIILDGNESDTPFMQEINKLIDTEDNFDELKDNKSLWHYCRRVDYLSRVGRYACLIIGVNDSKEELKEPLTKNGAKGLDDFLYLNTFDEGNIDIDEVETNPFSKRANKPLYYSTTLSNNVSDIGENQTSVGTRIHWTRVIHVAEKLKNNDIFAAPILENVYDLLDDLLKITAASGESAWQLMTRGLIASTRDGVKLPSDTTELRKAMESFMHEQMRVLELRGMDVQLTDGKIVDPMGAIKAVISLVSAATGIPQRILLGSEAGHLASSQDEKNWSQRIVSRQNNFAGPSIIRPLINRLIYCGVLPRPSSGNYTITWPSQLLLTELEKADKNNKDMSSLAQAVGPDKLPLVSFLRNVLNWPEDEIQKVLNDKVIEKRLSLIDFPMFSG